LYVFAIFIASRHTQVHANVHFYESHGTNTSLVTLPQCESASRPTISAVMSTETSKLKDAREALAEACYEQKRN